MATLQECYKILGVTPDDSASVVRKAYLELVKRWHPDAHAQGSNSRAKDQFFAIQQAYEQIKAHQDSEPERPSDPPNAASAPSPTPSTVSTELRAETLYASATVLGKQGLYREAIAELSVAIRVDPHFIQAYQYRGHLNSLLGLEYQADADLSKAKTLKRLGKSATAKSQADIENLARNYPRTYSSTYPRATQRSGFQRKRKPRTQGLSATSLALWSAIAVGLTIAGFMLFKGSVNQPQRIFPRPLNLESPALES